MCLLITVHQFVKLTTFLYHKCKIGFILICTCRTTFKVYKMHAKNSGDLTFYERYYPGKYIGLQILFSKLFEQTVMLLMLYSAWTDWLSCRTIWRTYFSKTIDFNFMPTHTNCWIIYSRQTTNCPWNQKSRRTYVCKNASFYVSILVGLDNLATHNL